MSNQDEARALNLSTIGRMTDDDARTLLERMRWPDGKPICPHCGVVGEATKIESREGTKTHGKLRAGVWNCRACREPFTVTVGTLFEGSHIPLSKWLLGFYLFADSKKSLSAAQLQRHLGLGSYRTAWHMAHRIRFAMANGGPFKPLRGDVEADEVFIGGKPRHRQGHHPGHEGKGKAWRDKKIPVAVLVSRDGKARARALDRVTAEGLRDFIVGNVDPSKSRLLSDEFKMYGPIGREFAGGHEFVRHHLKEYAKPGGVHSNTVESFNGLFKRAVSGAWHHISREHITRYLDEATFRWSHRDDTAQQRTLRALGQVGGVRLYYKKPKGGEPNDAGLVVDG